MTADVAMEAISQSNVVHVNQALAFLREYFIAVKSVLSSSGSLGSSLGRGAGVRRALISHAQTISGQWLAAIVAGWQAASCTTAGATPRAVPQGPSPRRYPAPAARERRRT